MTRSGRGCGRIFARDAPATAVRSFFILVRRRPRFAGRPYGGICYHEFMILVVNNKTALLPEIKNWLKDAPYVIKDREDDWGPIGSYSHIILSGGHGHSVTGHADFYRKELDLISHFKEGSTTLIGICLGFELIAYAFGSTLELLPQKDAGEVDIEATGDDPMFRGVQKMRVFESHRWTIKKLGDELEVLAKSKDGIEAIRHTVLPIYGFQFHPEASKDLEKGMLLRANLLQTRAPAGEGGEISALQEVLNASSAVRLDATISYTA